MYSKKASEKFDYPTAVFSRGVVNALAGDVVVTVFVMVMVTMFLSGGIVMADRRNSEKGRGVLKISGTTVSLGKNILRNDRWRPRLFAVLGPYEAKVADVDVDEARDEDDSRAGNNMIGATCGTNGAERRRKREEIENVYTLPVAARFKGQLATALRVFGVCAGVFCIPLILLLWLIVEEAAGHTWDQDSVVWVKVVPFALLQAVLQAMVVLVGFEASYLDDLQLTEAR